MNRRSLIRRPANWWAWFLMAAGGAMVLSGCVIPLDSYMPGSRHNIGAKTQSLLQPGITTKEEVFLLLGEPDYVRDDGQRIGYAWSKLKMVYILGVGFGTAAGGTVERNYLLRIRFDRDNRVVVVDLIKTWGEVPPTLDSPGESHHQ